MSNLYVKRAPVVLTTGEYKENKKGDRWVPVQEYLLKTDRAYPVSKGAKDKARAKESCGWVTVGTVAFGAPSYEYDVELRQEYHTGNGRVRLFAKVSGTPVLSEKRALERGLNEALVLCAIESVLEEGLFSPKHCAETQKAYWLVWESILASSQGSPAQVMERAKGLAADLRGFMISPEMTAGMERTLLAFAEGFDGLGLALGGLSLGLRDKVNSFIPAYKAKEDQEAVIAQLMSELSTGLFVGLWAVQGAYFVAPTQTAGTVKAILSAASLYRPQLDLALEGEAICVHAEGGLNLDGIQDWVAKSAMAGRVMKAWGRSRLADRQSPNVETTPVDHKTLSDVVRERLGRSPEEGSERGVILPFPGENR